jgi:hypothetical protein
MYSTGMVLLCMFGYVFVGICFSAIYNLIMGYTPAAFWTAVLVSPAAVAILVITYLTRHDIVPESDNVIWERHDRFSCFALCMATPFVYRIVEGLFTITGVGIFAEAFHIYRHQVFWISLGIWLGMTGLVLIYRNISRMIGHRLHPAG